MSEEERDPPSSEEPDRRADPQELDREGAVPDDVEQEGDGPGALDAATKATAERKKSRGLLLFLAAIAVVAGGLFIVRARRPEPLPVPPPRADLLDAVPASPMLLATIDLEALRGSRLGALLVSQEGPGVLGKVRSICGFEPVESLREMALVVPPSLDDADFGLVAVGDMSQEAIVECAEKVIAARGGKPVATTLGSFRTVRDASTSSGEIAVRPGGPLLVGAGNFLRAMVDTADGALPTVRTDSAHVALRAAIADVPLVRVSVVLSARQRATIADEVGRSGGRAPAALTAILAAALGATITPETVQLHAVILVEDDARAKELTEAFDAVRRERADDPLLRLLGLGQLLDRVRIRIEGTQIHLHLELTIAEAELIADKLGALREPHDVPVTPSSSAPSATVGPSSALPSAAALPSATALPSSEAAPPAPSAKPRRHHAD